MYKRQATSSDNGRTWTQATASNITATNGMPALKDYGGDQILVWAGNNAMGGESYARYPLTIAYSQDDMATWNQKLDLYSGTSMGMCPKASEWWKNPSANLAIQPSMAITQYGES